jgi:hypothetical protein
VNPDEIEDIETADSYVSINCRYYIKKLAGLTERSDVDDRHFHAYALKKWVSLHQRILVSNPPVDDIKNAIKRIESLEPELSQSDLDLMIEAQEDDNESLWGKGIRTYEQVLAESERQKGVNQ